MPDLFDNFFGKIGTFVNGGKTHQHYGAPSQVNTGSYYNYHSSATNNKYWMNRNEMKPAVEEEGMISAKERMGSIGSMNSVEEDPSSRKGSVVSDKIDI